MKTIKKAAIKAAFKLPTYRGGVGIYCGEII
jgi:hypothetical protein